ncbi:secondary thiamine-phosphate synthase enzyme YjbQ [Eubacteriaceae bacterium ES3]|nr:secondary thiamine-phosphate synthase enzyme YjbQ [Eubacteriaceae bacterium ES3]
MKKYELEIDGSEKLVDITPMVKEYIEEKRLKKGLVHITVPGKSSAVMIFINDELRLEREFFEKMNHLIPKYDGMRFTGWTTASVKSSMFSVNETLMVENGTLILDSVQSVYFVEFQGPGKRSFFINSMGNELMENEVAQVPEMLEEQFQIYQDKKEEEARIIEEMRREWRESHPELN